MYRFPESLEKKLVCDLQNEELACWLPMVWTGLCFHTRGCVDKCMFTNETFNHRILYAVNVILFHFLYISKFSKGINKLNKKKPSYFQARYSQVKARYEQIVQSMQKFHSRSINKMRRICNYKAT